MKMRITDVRHKYRPAKAVKRSLLSVYKYLDSTYIGCKRTPGGNNEYIISLQLTQLDLPYFYTDFRAHFYENSQFTTIVS